MDPSVRATSSDLSDTSFTVEKFETSDSEICDADGESSFSSSTSNEQTLESDETSNSSDDAEGNRTKIARTPKKEQLYKVVWLDGIRKYKCLCCERNLSSRQRITYHLFSAHNCSPVKYERKRYMNDPEEAVPLRTASRWKNKRAKLEDGKGSEIAPEDPVHLVHMAPSMVSPDGDNDESSNHEVIHVLDDHLLDDPLVDIVEEGDNGSTSSDEDTPDSDPLSSSEDEQISEDEVQISEEDAELSFLPPQLTVQETQALKILSCFLRNNLSASSAKDIIATLKDMFPDSRAINQLNYKSIWRFVEDSKLREFHYCIICFELFPEDENVFSCSTRECEGYRYKGPLSAQMRQDRQPRQCFVFADTESQLQSLLQSPGIWKEITSNKKNIAERKDATSLTDITDGIAYRRIWNEFVLNTNNLTALFNTDGVNLYSSSKIELWPIFLVINELSPSLRFARDNMLLVGMWQGKGKPPFKSYMTIFSKEMNKLYHDGIQLKPQASEAFTVKLSVICGSVDLPAKASLLNMTFYNGRHACITCEEEGEVVNQGRGHARCYPFRTPETKRPLRSEESIHYAMANATDSNRIKGFRGHSGLVALYGFQLSSGIVPDYMHCILLGATKMLLYKWFSSTENAEEYYVGNSLKTISERMQNIQPPEFIERLPRNLGKHYTNFKATELQSWLLYYGLPCLEGILPDIFLEHFGLLSEGTYILLGECISADQLRRAEDLLNKFYLKFETLYPKGSCGLNIHNIGAHMVDYVRHWGPLWAWSCFAFEDANACLLKTTHGTGNVTKQVMRMKHAQSLLRMLGQSKPPNFKWKNMQKFENCFVAGLPKELTNDKFTEILMNDLSIETCNLQKIFRIVLLGTRFYAKQYGRMKKRICNFVLLQSGEVGSIEYFFFKKDQKDVFAAITLHTILQHNRVHNLETGLHLVPVVESDTLVVRSVTDISCRLIYVSTTNNQREHAYVARLPNSHGHSVFK